MIHMLLWTYAKYKQKQPVKHAILCTQKQWQNIIKRSVEICKNLGCFFENAPSYYQ